MIRLANENDIGGLLHLLKQVHAIHASIRPDIFKSGGIKYTRSDLLAILSDKSKPIFVFESDGKLTGYAFCIIEKTEETTSLLPETHICIDDLCVDESVRGMSIGSQLYTHIREYAKTISATGIRLSVWEGNDNAKAFYAKSGMKPLKTIMEEKL